MNLEDRIAELEARVAELPRREDITDAIIAAVSMLLENVTVVYGTNTETKPEGSTIKSGTVAHCSEPIREGTEGLN
jgi:hypothetical protein